MSAAGCNIGGICAVFGFEQISRVFVISEVFSGFVGIADIIELKRVKTVIAHQIFVYGKQVVAGFFVSGIYKVSVAVFVVNIVVPAFAYAQPFRLLCGKAFQLLRRLSGLKPEIAHKNHFPSLPAKRPLAQAHWRL